MAIVSQDIDINRPISTVYNQWTQFEYFPAFLNDVVEVRQLSDDQLHWKVNVAGTPREFDTLITEQRPDERIAWKSVGAPHNAGLVTFYRIDDGHTRVRLQIDWHPEGFVEKVGSIVQIDDARIAGDLRRFKTLVESTEHPTGGWRGTIEAPGEAAGGATGESPSA